MKHRAPNPVTKVILKYVTLSFPSLESPEVFDSQIGKYAATFLLDKDSTNDSHASLTECVRRLLNGKPFVIDDSKNCVKDGDLAQYDDYYNKWSVKASCKDEPIIVDQKKAAMSASDLYAGCKVNAIIDLWLQDNKYGRRINANLYAVQFVAHGAPIGNGQTLASTENILEDLPF